MAPASSAGVSARRIAGAVALAAALALVPQVALGATTARHVPAPVHATTTPVMATSADGLASLVVSFAHAEPDGAVHAALDALGEVVPVVPEAGVWSVRMAPDAAARDRALAVPGVATAEWSLMRRADDIAPAPPAAPLALQPVATPTDTYFGPDHQAAWFGGVSTWAPDLTGVGARPRIAILDGGIDSQHEEWRGPDSPLVAPFSAWTGRQEAEDWGRTGHGTHVAGIAAAPANGLGVVGVAPASGQVAQVIPVQIADRDGFSTDATMMRGIRWAVRNGAKVINISAGGPGASAAFQSVIDWAFRGGALVVASVGNDGQDASILNYPAAYAHVLGVAAQCTGTVSADCPTATGLATFSDRNASVDVVAPGVDILSSVPPRITTNAIAPGYATKTGTSMAAPYVTGLAALVFAANPGATPYQVMRQIMNTAVDGGPVGRDNAYGTGFVNPTAAVTMPLPPDDPTEVNDDVGLIKRESSVAASDGVISVTAAIDAQNDPRDLYPVTLRKGQTIHVRANGDGSPRMALSLWRPGTVSIRARGASPQAMSRVSKSPKLGVVVPATGRWYVGVSAASGSGQYTLQVTP